MADLEQLTARLDRVESELAIRRLAHEYCHGADKQDIARWAGVWSEDAVWALGHGQDAVGLAAICDAVRGQWGAFRQMHHWTANLVVEIDGDSATGEADVDISVELADGVWVPRRRHVPRPLCTPRRRVEDHPARARLRLLLRPSASECRR